MNTIGIGNGLDRAILGYIRLAPVGCHMNVGVLNIAYLFLVADACHSI